MTDLTLDDYAARATLEEPEWLAVWQAAGAPSFPEWAAPRTVDAPGSEWIEPVSADLAAALKIRSGAALTIEVATALGGVAALGEVCTDLGAVLTVVRRLTADPLVGPSSTKMLLGVEVSATVTDHLVDEVMRLFPPVEITTSMAEVSIPAELSVAFGRALTQGDQAMIDAICADQGWVGPPEVILALNQELKGNAIVTIQPADGAPVIGQWLLTGKGWVELSYTDQEIVRHRPCSPDDIRQLLVQTLTNVVSAVYAKLATKSEGISGE
jgi:hypothetical protein